MYRQSDCQQDVILLDVLSKYEPEAFAYESWNTPEVQHGVMVLLKLYYVLLLIRLEEQKQIAKNKIHLL
jgi:hypothetical protein